MRKTFFLSLILVFLLVSPVLAQEETVVSPNPTASGETETIGEVSDPGILPDSPFYFLKNWGRTLKMTFTFDEAKKAELELKYANEDALALKKLCEEKDKCDLAQKFAPKFEARMEKVAERVEKAREKGKDVEEIVEKLKENYIQHQQVLLRVLEKAPQAAQEGLTRALENSEKGIENAIEKIQGAQERRELRSQLNLQIKNSVQNMGEETKVQVKEKLQERFREIESPQSNILPQNQERNSAVCQKKCGDNICQEVVCLGSGCPCAETSKFCPQDCPQGGENQEDNKTKSVTPPVNSVKITPQSLLKSFFQGKSE